MGGERGRMNHVQQVTGKCSVYDVLYKVMYCI